MESFPTPVRLSAGATRWRLSDLEAYEAACAGEAIPERRNAENERFLSARQVAHRYGASVPTVWRWCSQKSGGAVA